jgi:hypothetical protein
MTTGDRQFKVVVTAALLLIRKVKIIPSVNLAHAKSRDRNGEISHLTCDLQDIYDSRRIFGRQLRETVLGQLPVRLVVGLIDNRAANGNRERNPFNLQHFPLTEIGIYLDGQLHGLKPLKLDFVVGRYIATHVGLFSGINKMNTDERNDRSRSDYANGYALYAYDLTPELAECDHVNRTSQGTVRLDVKFGAALTQTVTIVT